jgi:multiple sugar transport system ATP-binding protein
MTMGDRIAILDGGELQQVATPLECYHRPANRFVAGFIGEPSMNFFDVTREDRVLRKGAFEYPVSRAIAEDIGDATDLVMGVRPEDIRLLDDASGPHDFETTVSVVEPMGDENTVHLSFADGHTRADGADGAQVVIAAEAGAEEQREMIATVEGMRRVESGDSVIAHIPEEAIHVFDARNGTALHNREFEDDTQLQEPLD